MPDPRNVLGQFYLEINDEDAPPELYRDVLAVTVESSLHLPDVATLVLHDTRLQWIDDPRVDPGKRLKVSTRVGSRTETIFDGELVEIEPDFGASTHRLVIRGFDRLHRLGRGRHVRSFVNVTDGDLIQRIAQEVGLRADVGPTPHVHEYVLQANETNLSFLKNRAAALGYLLFVAGETLHCSPPPAAESVIDLKWGDTLLEFHPRLTTIGQFDGATVRGWDPNARQSIVGQVQNGTGAPHVGEARWGGAVAQQAFNMEATQLVVDRPVRNQDFAERLAQATADRAASAFIEAEGACSGIPALVAGASVSITAVGRRFQGTYFVTSATHSFTSAEGYRTRFSVSGLQPSTLTALLAPSAAAGPPGLGIVIGVVTDNQDPDGLGRVKVKFPWLSDAHASDWARIAAPGAGRTRGMQYLPEVNDEVLVAFEMGDMHYPYVIGGLWNRQDPPPKPSGAAVTGTGVQQRVIRSRTGHTIVLDDSDAGGGITIEDKNGNKVVLDTASNEMRLQARGNMTFEAQGRVEIKGMGVKVDGGAGPVDVSGSLINLN